MKSQNKDVAIDHVQIFVFYACAGECLFKKAEQNV